MPGEFPAKRETTGKCVARPRGKRQDTVTCVAHACLACRCMRVSRVAVALSAFRERGVRAIGETISVKVEGFLSQFRDVNVEIDSRNLIAERSVRPRSRASLAPSYFRSRLLSPRRIWSDPERIGSGPVRKGIPRSRSRGSLLLSGRITGLRRDQHLIFSF